MDYSLRTIDIGDFFILDYFIDFDPKDTLVLNKLSALYKELDIDIEIGNVINNKITPEYKSYLDKDISRILPWNILKHNEGGQYGGGDMQDIDKPNIISKLHDYIEKLIETYKLMKVWKWPKTNEEFETPIGCCQFTQYEIIKDNNIEDLSFNNFANISDQNDNILGENFGDIAHGPRSTKKEKRILKYYLLFNNIINISFIFECEEYLMDSLSKRFKEFIIIDELKSNQIVDAFKPFLHKKTFSNVDDVKKKLKGLLALYGDNTCIESSEDTLRISELNKVKKYIDSYYISDPLNKIKIHDFYDHIINTLCIDFKSVGAFKKRLAGYLLELGVNKTRFSDGYYFVGLVLNR